MLRAAFLFFLLFSEPALAADLSVQTRSTYLNNQGLAELENKNLGQAQKNFLEAMALDRNNIAARMNLALTFEMAGDSERAMREFASITTDPKLKDSPELFFAYFNLAKIRSDKKDVEGALAAYQSALRYRPDSMEVKTNIELLVQQGGGGGSGEQQENQDQGDGDRQQQPQEQGSDQQEQEKQKQENPQELSKDDIKKIFEELKNQEQKIRELEYGEGTRKDSGGKDW